MDKFFSKFPPRDEFGPDQFIVRMLTGLVALVTLATRVAEPPAWGGIALALLYLSWTCGGLRGLLPEPPAAVRRGAELAADLAAVTIALAIGGPAAAPILFAFLAIAHSNGLRYGVRDGLLAAVAALALFAGLVRLDPRWSSEMLMASSWLVALALVPPQVVAVGARISRRAERYRRRSRRLAIAANHDRLTGLPNRAQFERALEAALASLRANGDGAIAVLFIDVDGFKACNDLHGHDAGDQMLGMIAQDLRRSVRSTDVAARYGGDEFAVLLTHLRSVNDAARVVSGIIDSAKAPRIIGGHTVQVGASAGMSYVRAQDAAELDVRGVIARADRALLRAKRGGKNTYRLGTSPQAIVDELALAE